MAEAKTTYEKMDPDLKAKWLAALRSGDYKQCSRTLYDDIEHSYCCLGVNLKVQGYKETPDKQTLFSDSPHGDWKDAVLVDRAAVDVLARMNDSGKSFAEIADWIEENL